MGFGFAVPKDDHELWSSCCSPSQVLGLQIFDVIPNLYTSFIVLKYIYSSSLYFFIWKKWRENNYLSTQDVSRIKHVDYLQLFLVKAFISVTFGYMTNLHSSPSFCSPACLNPCGFLYFVSSYAPFRHTASLHLPLNVMDSKLLLPVSFTKNVFPSAIYHFATPGLV